MPLSAEQKARLAAAAESAGVDAAELEAAAESLSEESEEEDTPRSDGKPTFDKMLIGAFPFVKVRELRTHWLGLPERIKDDEMMCGEFAAKYGGQPSGGSPPTDTEE